MQAPEHPMQISSLQMRQLAQHADRHFVARLCAFVRTHCATPDARHPRLVPEDDAALRCRVDEHLARARGHGLDGEQALAGFVAVAFSYSPHFDEVPQARALLQDASLAPEARMQRIFDALVRAEQGRRAAGSRA